MDQNQRKKLRELKSNSTQVAGWYAHSQYDGYHLGEASVRGPFGRWFLVSGGDNGMNDPKIPTPVADLYDDAKYCAAAMMAVPELLDDYDKLAAKYKKAVDLIRDLGPTDPLLVKFVNDLEFDKEFK